MSQFLSPFTLSQEDEPYHDWIASKKVWGGGGAVGAGREMSKPLAIV